MSHERVLKMRSLEGRRVNLALRDGRRIDNCQLVSAGRPGLRTVWVYANDADAFVPLPEIVDLREVAESSDLAA